MWTWGDVGIDLGIYVGRDARIDVGIDVGIVLQMTQPTCAVAVTVVRQTAVQIVPTPPAPNNGARITVF